MRLERVRGKGFLVVCLECGRSLRTDRRNVYADLDGEPFRAYYCEECGEEKRKEEQRTSLSKLREEVKEVAAYRGHALRWETPSHRDNRAIQIGQCENPNCSAWVMVDTRPPPNGIDIGGPAVALHCPAE